MYKEYLNFIKYINFSVDQLLRTVSPLLRGLEKKHLHRLSKQPLKHQPIFIIGAPRTGSTILYQTLTNLYDVLYIDNLVCRFHRNLFLGFWLSNKLYGSKPHNNYKAFHGRTKGGNAPSECGHFWYRWLPKDHHFIDYDEITSKMIEEIRCEITAVINYFDKPIVFKNLNAGMRLRLLKKTFPSAKLIFIRRDPRFVALSILKGRKMVKAKEGEIWGIMPPNHDKIAELDELDMCCAQIYYIEKQIKEDLSLFLDQNIKIIHYQELSLSIVNKLAKWMSSKRRDNYIYPVFRRDATKALDEIIEIERVVKRYSFDKSLFI